jgi:hypothetical protein
MRRSIKTRVEILASYSEPLSVDAGEEQLRLYTVKWARVQLS